MLATSPKPTISEPSMRLSVLLHGRKCLISAFFAPIGSIKTNRSAVSTSASVPSVQPMDPICSANGSNQTKEITILHFNDVYNIEPRKIEPIGGAAHFAAAIQQFRHENPIKLFSGDALNPSLLSAFTKGQHMVPVLNKIGVHAAAVGNHDFDFGIDVLRSYLWQFKFPWLLSNVMDIKTGKPLGGAEHSTIIKWEGISIGLIGLVEREWLLTIPSIEADRDIQYLDFIEEGRRLAKALRASGADIIIALTHMRTLNDKKLAEAVPEIQLLLGGHDHEYEIIETQPYKTMIIKSGTDFREFSHIKLQIDMADSTKRPVVTCTRVEVTSDYPEEPSVAATVAHYQSVIGSRMEEAMGRSFVDLDATFDCVRTRESNLGNLLGDIMRLGLNADVAFFNGGTIRSDQIHSAGTLVLRDFVTMLPFTDELVVVQLTGADIVQALETGVASYPSKEGRFLQLSNISYEFDPAQPSGSRVIPSSVTVAGAPVDLNKTYSVATKAYLRSGKDGFDSLKDAKVLVDGETAPRLATLYQYLLTRIEELNTQRPGPSCDSSTSSSSGGGFTSTTSTSSSGSSSSTTTATVTAAGVDLVPVNEAPLQLEACAHGLDALYYYDRNSCTFGIAPKIEGRIRIKN